MDTQEALERETRADYTAPRRNRKLLLTAGIAVAALVIAGGIYAAVEIRSLNDQLAAYDTQAAEDRTVAAEQAAAAAKSAEDAAASAEAAQAATDSLVAAEEAAAAEAAAVEAQRAANVANGLTPEGKCPAGTTAGQVDDNGVESLCAATGPGGKVCAEYTDNVCTSWLKE